MGFGLKISKNQAFYFQPLNGNLKLDCFCTLFTNFGAGLLTAYPKGQDFKQVKLSIEFAIDCLKIKHFTESLVSSP